MLVWLGISVVLAAVVLVGPWRWAIMTLVFFLPFAGTAVAMVGPDPILVPLVLSVAIGLRYCVSLFSKEFREEALILLSREPWLLAFLAYAIVSGLFFPRLFEGETSVFTLSGGMFVLMPLGPSHVSIPQIAYLLLAAIVFFAIRHAVFKFGPAPAVLALLAQAIAIGSLGALQVLFGLVGAPLDLSWIVNNEGAAIIVNAIEGGFLRVTGIFVEASAFAMWGACALGLALFLLINRIYFRACLVVAMILGPVMLLSTSATAYGGLAILALTFSVFVALDRDPKRRAIGLAILTALAVIALIVLGLIFTTDYGPLYQLRLVLEAQIFGKGYSPSGVERGAWAAAAFQNGFDTFGLGAGYGAVRGSGIASTLFGAVGIVGCFFFVMYLAPKAWEALGKARGREMHMGAACGMAMVPAFGVMLISATSIGPWDLFWCLAAVTVASYERGLVLERLSGRIDQSSQAPEPTGSALGRSQ